MFSKEFVTPEQRKKDACHKLASALFSDVTPERPSVIKSVQFTEDASDTDRTSISQEAPMKDLADSNQEREEAKSHLELKLSRKLEKLGKKERKIQVTNLNKKKWRNRRSEANLKATFTNPAYIAKLTCPLVKYLDDFDSGKEPICTANCNCNCQHYFNSQPALLVAEMNKWWGVEVTKQERSALLHRDILIGFDKNSGEQKWFLGDKEVCKHFYCRARGAARTTVEKAQREFLSERASFLEAVDPTT